MERYPCKSRLVVTVRNNTLFINLRHGHRHLVYRDTSMPTAAIEFIRDAPESASPAALAEQVREQFENVSNAQVFNIWREKMESHYKRDDNQLKSAALLLKEFPDLVDVLEPVGVPADVEILVWGMKKLGDTVGRETLETALDATYSTNSRGLELYALMGELDNAGFPLAYCLMTTATSISQGKRKKTLTAFLSCVKAQYGTKPEFTHVDKDMGEIGALRSIWPAAKTSICWWHINDAVSKRLKKAKLSTTPYKPAKACEEFTFISCEFVPAGKPDKTEYEGGKPDDASDDEDDIQPTQNPNKLTFKLPLPQPSPPRRVDEHGIKVIRIPAGAHTFMDLSNSTDSEGEDEESAEAASTGQKRKRGAEKPGRTFCEPDLQPEILRMMKAHSHMHALIPGRSHPSPEGIRYLAVKETYDFCVAHDLREAWAYLWGNWYRKERWNLWARAAHPTIPRLRTTMICESHWRKLKHEYLHEYYSPRLDLLVWVIITKLCAPYYKKLTLFTVPTGRSRVSELASWRETFRSLWRQLEKRDISDRVDDVYRPDAERWVCTCPSYATSRFLVCKHLVQLVQRVPTKFFREVQRRRTIPFWQHPTLIPLVPSSGGGAPPGDDGPRDWETPEDEDDGIMEPYLETQADRDFDASAATFEAEFDAEVALIEEFVAGLKHQRRFRDPKMLEMLRKRGAGFLKLGRTCIAKEKAANDNRARPVRTWDKDYADAMYYRPRPREEERET
ncbi:SWIM-type domain-containing protein [Mycena kentingensis (nom. inval.)]|nr:SWIM-type domain-containing protein [Mycena kentingensis (nom. inval.)]